MNINDLANNLGNELVKGILGEIKVNDPSITPEKVEKLNSIFYNKVLFDIYWDFWTEKHNYKELNYIHDIHTYLKEISKSKLIQIYQDLQKAIDKIQEDKIPGGLSQGKTLYDIAKHHKVDVKLLRSQLRKGIKVELEHTSDKSIAKEIAMDHLYEDPFYYDKLEKIETNEIKVNKPIQPDENFLRKLKYDVKWFEDADLDHDNDLISNLKKLTIYKEIPNEQLKQLIKKVKSEIDEIKINNPSITFDSCSDLIDSIRDSEWMREGERYKEWGEFWDRQPSLGKHISLYYNKHPKEIPQLYQDLQKFIKDNNIQLNESVQSFTDKLLEEFNKGVEEIKINDPRIKFPIHVKDREDWENNIMPRLKAMGYKWKEGEQLDSFYIPVNAFLRNGLNIFADQNSKFIWYGVIRENQSQNKDNFKKYINYLNQILEYCCKDLNIDRPEVKIILGEEYTQQNKSFGGYVPGENKIYLVIKNRNCRDSCMTLAHEIRHHWQFLNGKIKPGDGKDGDPIENDAQSYAGMVIRKFARENPEILELFYHD